MAGLDTLNPKHEIYIQNLKGIVEKLGFIVDDWGLEKIAPAIRASGISEDFSLPALRLRSHYDLLLRHPKYNFICELDGKTIMFRNDTGNIAIEVWPVLLGRTGPFPRLLAFEGAQNYGLWLDCIPDTWLNTIFMPDRWPLKTKLSFMQYLRELLKREPYYKNIPWNTYKASGDPFFVWPISKILESGAVLDMALLKRATGFKETLF